MPVYNLTNKNDIFDSSPVLDWANGSHVFGDNGNDEITVVGRHLELYGENGKDSIMATGRFNDLFGGNGKDYLEANGRFNLLDGGNGKDHLVSNSSGGFFQVGLGNTLTGGNGKDIFESNNSSDLVVNNNSGSNADDIDDGDVIEGVIDVVTDWFNGDTLMINASSENAGPVGLDGFGANHQHLELADGEYALITGELTGDGEFTVDEDGPDILAVWDHEDGGNDPFFHGAVAILDAEYSSIVVV